MQQKKDKKVLDSEKLNSDDIKNLMSLTPEEVAELHNAANEVIDDLPEEKRKVVQQVVKITELYSGPLPHPSILKQYNEINPDFAERIMSMAEKDQEHIIELNKKTIEMRGRDGLFGMIFAFAIVIGAVVLGAVLLLNDKDVGGYGSLITAVVAAAVVFFGGKKENKE